MMGTQSGDPEARDNYLQQNIAEECSWAISEAQALLTTFCHTSLYVLAYCQNIHPFLINPTDQAMPA